MDDVTRCATRPSLSLSFSLPLSPGVQGKAGGRVPNGFGGGLVLINESENRRKERQALPSDKDGPGYVPHDDFQQIPTNFLTLEQLVDSEPQFPKPFSFHTKPSFPSEAQPQEIKGSLWFMEMAPGTG